VRPIRHPAGSRSSASTPRAETLRSWLENTTWTEKAYFALPEWNHIVELSDGKLVISDLPTRTHQELVGSLYLDLSLWNRAARRGVVLIAPYRVRLWRGKVREQDVVFYLAEYADCAQEQKGGPPNLAIEVLSPSTRHTDLREKFAEYARAGVEEYWLVDPESRWIDVHALDGHHYQHLGRYHTGDHAPSRLLPGFAVDVAALFQPESGASEGSQS
jgi:Uma2 family endonuclease